MKDTKEMITLNENSSHSKVWNVRGTHVMSDILRTINMHLTQIQKMQ